jgi:hypothetical protein
LTQNLIAYNVNKHVINIMLFRKGLKDWAQSGIVKDYLIVHLWEAILDAKVNLSGLLVEWPMLVERDFLLGESGG